jgi:hypothetical protein
MGVFTLKNLPDKQTVKIVFSADEFETYTCRFKLDTTHILNVQAQLRPIGIAATASIANADIVLEGDNLNRIIQTCTTIDSFILRINNLFVGTRFNFSSLLNATILVNGAYITWAFIPKEVARVEICKPNSAAALSAVGLVSFHDSRGIVNFITKNPN